MQLSPRFPVSMCGRRSVSARRVRRKPQKLASLSALLPNPLRGHLWPLNYRPPCVNVAVTQEQIDEVLIGHAQLGRHFFEVVHRRGINAHGDLALELLGIRVLAGLGKIVFFSHRWLQYTLSSRGVARLAEINRIMASGSR